MVVISCQVEMYLPDSQSLKDKRQVIKSLKGRIHSRFEVAVAEVDHSQLWQRSTLGVAVVSNAYKHADEVLSNVVRFIEQDLRVQVLDIRSEQC